MASEAQILANRRNAEKSTGPRTEEGKAVASQNAVKHGLTGARDVIGSEDQSEFDLHRAQMLGELAPAGAIETLLAERIVSLSWRLRRVERLQNRALDYLAIDDGSDPAGDGAELGSFVQIDSDAEPDLALGRAVVKDFAHEKALDRLLMYERRIESSLYRSMSELRTLKTSRRMEREEEAATRYRAARPLAGTTPGGGGATWDAAANRGLTCKTNPIPGRPIDCLPATGLSTMIVNSP